MQWLVQQSLSDIVTPITLCQDRDVFLKALGQFLAESIHWTDVCGLPRSMEIKCQKVLIGLSCIAGQMN